MSTLTVLKLTLVHIDWLVPVALKRETRAEGTGPQEVVSWGWVGAGRKVYPQSPLVPAHTRTSHSSRYK